MDIQKLIDDYASWLKSEISVDKIGEYYEITTPYLDNSNDYLQIYVKLNGDDILLTDDSLTIQKLKMSGIQLSSNRKRYLRTVLNQYGAQLDKDEIIAHTSVKDFAQKKHMFVQAMLRVDDMLITAKPRGQSVFLDDVSSFLDHREIFYSDNVQFTGKSGFLHTYDFLLQRSKTKPERLCQTINNPAKASVGNSLFAWNDTKPARREGSQLIVFLNDKNGISEDIEDAYHNYDVGVIRWSQRNDKKNLEMLSAS